MIRETGIHLPSRNLRGNILLIIDTRFNAAAIGQAI